MEMTPSGQHSPGSPWCLVPVAEVGLGSLAASALVSLGASCPRAEASRLEDCSLPAAFPARCLSLSPGGSSWLIVSTSAGLPSSLSEDAMPTRKPRNRPPSGSRLSALPVLHPDAAGIDVGGDFHVVAAPSPDQQSVLVHSFGACT